MDRTPHDHTHGPDLCMESPKFQKPVLLIFPKILTFKPGRENGGDADKESKQEKDKKGQSGQHIVCVLERL